MQGHDGSRGGRTTGGGLGDEAPPEAKSFLTHQKTNFAIKPYSLKESTDSKTSPNI